MAISGSVGQGGKNNITDVKTVQKMLQRNGFPLLKDDGRIGPKTIKAIKDYQSRFMSQADGVIDVNGRSYNNLAQNKFSSSASGTTIQPTPVDNHPIAGPLSVSAGQVTFNAEGNDFPNNMYFSRRIHWPGNAKSGVTIGRGYDMGSRSEGSIFSDMVQAGLPAVQAQQMAQSHGKKGTHARDFVHNQREAIGTISHQMQIRLFELIYPRYVQSACANYDRYTLSLSGRVEWSQLKPAIREILVDFVYQGFTRGPNPMIAGMTNDFDTLIHYIDNTPDIRVHEPARQRANYLRAHLT